MTLVDAIQLLQKVSQFKGGNDKQRAHLNALVDRINAIIDAAQQVAPPVAGAGTLLMTILANGTPTNVVFTAYVATQPA